VGGYCISFTLRPLILSLLLRTNFWLWGSLSLPFRFGPRESKKAMMYSDIGRLNCSVTYTTFATPVRGQVRGFIVDNMNILCCIVNIHIYTNIYTHTYTISMYVHESMHVCVYTHTRSHTFFCVYLHIHVCAYICICVSMYVSIYLYAPTHTHMYTYIYVCVSIYIYIYIHADTHIH